MFKHYTKLIAGFIGAIAAFFFVFWLIVFVFLFGSKVRAQPTAPPTEIALGQKLLAEIQAGLTCEANKITMQKRLEELERRLAEATKKPEPTENK